MTKEETKKKVAQILTDSFGEVATNDHWPLEEATEKLMNILATKPESPKEKCDHDHLCCPGGIETVRCAYCGKSMYHEPTLPDIEPLEVEEYESFEELTPRIIGEALERHSDKIQELTDRLNTLSKTK